VDADGLLARRFRLLTWDQVREMKSEGICFGSHTLHHCILPVEDARCTWRELQGAKTLIESRLGTSVDMIAYPNGSYNDEIIRIAHQEGYRMGVTLDKEYVSSSSDPMRIGRFVMSQRDVVAPNGRFSRALFEYETSALILYAKRLIGRLFWGRKLDAGKP
jgi:peptidoglycan/xylan/chitin deacetylase (PgdA/CDA1 family)